MDGLLFTGDDGGLVHFVILSVIIGGVLSIAAGRAIARTWRPFLAVPFYMLILAAAVRFLHYGLFGEELLNVQYYIVTLVLVLLGSFYGFRSARAKQMATQYSWIYQRSGPIGWSARS